jgi:CMP-N,N'-diacetyllegionaminic acid synthase
MVVKKIKSRLKTLAIIPARGGSKGLPGKNKRKLHSRPLVSWALSTAAGLDIEGFALSSDDPEILSFASEFDSCTPITRPAELSADDVPDQPVLMHSLQVAENKTRIRFDRVILLQPTAPARSLEQITSALEIHSSLPQPERSSLWSVTRVPAHFNAAKQISLSSKGFVVPRPSRFPPRRQDLKATYIRSGEFYILGRLALEDPYLMGDYLEIFETPEPAINIDTLGDFQLAETLLKPKGSRLVRMEA